MAFNIVTEQSQFIPKWHNNDKSDNPIKIKLKMLTVEDYWKVMAICDKMRDYSNNAINFTEISEMIGKISPIFNRNILSIENLTVDNKPIKPCNIIDYPVLIELITEIINELVIISSLTNTDKKKSAEQ